MNKLEEVSFSKVVHYKNDPVMEHWHHEPATCSGFCISCEQNNVLANGISLNKLSHGCHSDVFYKILGDFESTKVPLNKKIMFLLESPGADYFGDSMIFQGVEKRPPVNHYYFTPKIKSWPTKLPQKRDAYGEQFAYIIRHFNLKNAYFTNVVKCGKFNEKSGSWEAFRADRKRDNKIAQNCYEEILSKEIELFNPDVIFSFGSNARWLYEKVNKLNIPHYNLNHPRRRMNLAKNITENLSIIENALQEEEG